jgi:CDP-diacylglycerol--serine O-phosphatidyltransferase
MIGFYNYTVILTYIGAILGVCGIVASFNGNILLAIVFLMLSAVCDMFDGKIARTMKRTKQEKRFGIQIDSLSDFVCFGVQPAMIGYNIGMKAWYFLPIIIYYILAALIRLAYYNVMEEERQNKTDKDLEMCTGLPVPPSAIIFPVVYLVCQALEVNATYAYAAVMVLVATLFIKRFSIKKLKTKGLLVMIALGLIVLTLLFVLK